jgi:glycosyltransferase involved in cell wall biosynthesis
MTPPPVSSISVVLPAWNEAENIERTLTQCFHYLEQLQQTWGIDYEVIVVNDGSTDATPAIATEIAKTAPCLHILHHPRNLGYGAALRTGFDHASKEFIFLMDSDGQFDIQDMDRLLEQVSSEQQIIIGYRYKRADPAIRSINARLYHWFIFWVLGLKFKDMDCAFKLFRRAYYRAVRPIKANGALFSAEFLFKLTQAGFPIVEVPVRHFPRRFGQQSGAKLSVILKMFWECWQMKRELTKGKTTAYRLPDILQS